jgi:alkylhydroperoxidase family enzyme
MEAGMSDSPTPRIEPREPPYPEAVAETLRRMMPPGVEPLKLFRTVAWNEHVLERFRGIGAYLLNFGKLDPIDREIVIHRTCARCGCEYEWGVHAASFGAAAGLSPEQLAATVVGGPASSLWSERDALLLGIVDELHDTGTVAATTWERAEGFWNEAQRLELLLIAGWYHAIAFIANGAGVEREEWAARFPSAANR